MTTTTPRGLKSCPVCSQVIPLRTRGAENGRFARHTRNKVVCPASGMAPLSPSLKPYLPAAVAAATLRAEEAAAVAARVAIAADYHAHRLDPPGPARLVRETLLKQALARFGPITTGGVEYRVVAGEIERIRLTELAVRQRTRVAAEARG